MYKQNKENNSIFEVALRCICSKFEDSDYYTVMATILRTDWTLNRTIYIENKWEQ